MDTKIKEEPIYSQPNNTIRKVPSFYLRQRPKEPPPSLPPLREDLVIKDVLLRQQSYILLLESEVKNLRANGGSPVQQSSQIFVDHPDSVMSTRASGTGHPTVPPKTKRQTVKQQLEQRCQSLERKVEQLESALEATNSDNNPRGNHLGPSRSEEGGESLSPAGVLQQLSLVRHQTGLVENFERLVTELQKKHSDESSALKSEISELRRHNVDLAESNDTLTRLLVKAKTRIQDLLIERRKLAHRVTRLQTILHAKETNLNNTESKLHSLVGWSQKLEHERDCIKGVARERARSEAELVQRCAADAAMVERLKQKLKQMYSK